METMEKSAKEIKANSLNSCNDWLQVLEERAVQTKKPNDYVMVAVAAKMKSIIENIPITRVSGSSEETRTY